MPHPALITNSAGDGRIHNHPVSRLETRCLFPGIGHNGTAFMADRIWEMHNLIPNASLGVIVEIGSAYAHANDLEQEVCGTQRRRRRLVDYFYGSDSGKHCGFHNWSFFDGAEQKIQSPPNNRIS